LTGPTSTATLGFMGLELFALRAIAFYIHSIKKIS